MNLYVQIMLKQKLTLRLLWSEDQDGDLGGVWLADRVCDGQLELVHPRCQVGHYNLVVKVGFLQDTERQCFLIIHTSGQNICQLSDGHKIQ